MLELTIEPKQEGKGRSFSAFLLSYVQANALWSAGDTTTDVIRPVWAMFAGSENELRPFMANLQLGRKAEYKTSYSRRSNSKFEFLKSLRFQTAWQRTPVGATATIFFPTLFRMDPGMVDPEGVEFCILPEPDWLIPPGAEILSHLAKVKNEVPEEHLTILGLAPIFAAFLDRRTRCPLVPDPRFYAQILSASLRSGLSSLSVKDTYRYRNEAPWGHHTRFLFKETTTSDVGLCPGIVCKVDHLSLEIFLAEQVRVYFEAIGENQ